jgi:hypothetical protein
MVTSAAGPAVPLPPALRGGPRIRSHWAGRRWLLEVARAHGIMSGPAAICRCRCKESTRESGIDERECLLPPLLAALEKIHDRAAEIRGEEPRWASGPLSSPKSPRLPRGRSWTERWNRVRKALDEVNRVLEEERIPRGSLTCGLCSSPITLGEFHTFYATCYSERFTTQVDLRPLKRALAAEFTNGHPARDMADGLPDTMPRVEVGGLALALLAVVRPTR